MSPRNVFENHDEENEEPKTVPLKLGVGGPIIGEAQVDKDGNIISGDITDPEVRRSLAYHRGFLSFGTPSADVPKPFVEELPEESGDPYGKSKEWYEQNLKKEE